MNSDARPMAIEARGLVKIFRTARRATGLLGTLRSLVAPEMVAKTAVADVSFSVAQGELLAMLGPNGAGKSTTIKMLTGIITPTAGEAIVAGVVPYRERERNAHNVGAVFGQRTQLWWDLPARESFRILRDIYGVGRAKHEARLREFDSLLELSSFWDTRVRHLSLGQRVRCDLAAALLHDPPVVFLDEPTIGMDVVVKEQVRTLLRHQVEQRGRTVLLTTHDMTEVGRLAERVVLINHGHIVFDGTLTEIRARFGGAWTVQAEAARLGETRLAAIAKRIDADLLLGRQATLVGELRGLVKEYPLNESLRCQLMKALHLEGRRVEALEVYQETRAMLTNEFGLDPGPALARIQQQILNGDPSRPDS